LNGSLLFLFGCSAFYPGRAAVRKAEAKTIVTTESRTNPKPQSEAEQYILDQLKRGLKADLSSAFHQKEITPEMLEVRAEFLKALFTNRDPLLQFPQGINIAHAKIIGEVKLIGAEVPYDITISDCPFEASVRLDGSHFAGNLELIGARFAPSSTFSLNEAIVDGDFRASNCTFQRAEFFRLKVGRNASVGGSTFSQTTTFRRLHVGEDFRSDHCTFQSRVVEFDEMRVDGTFAAGCEFIGDIVQTEADKSQYPLVSFAGVHAPEFFLDHASFANVSVIDFTRMKADLISFDDVNLKTPSMIVRKQMTFVRLSPMNAKGLGWILSTYDAEFYRAVETSLRTHGYGAEADEVFVQGKRAERQQKCPSLWRQCQNPGAFFWGLFVDALAGYGKRLQHLLYWSLLFLLIGTIVFWSEKGMRTKDWKDAPQYAGKYNPFWYSLDLFLPIIRLGEADLWTPKDNRRWANLYKKVHIIVGSLFVPIGLAAWTGIIK
jgi:hypothetical protein